MFRSYEYPTVLLASLRETPKGEKQWGTAQELRMRMFLNRILPEGRTTVFFTCQINHLGGGDI